LRPDDQVKVLEDRIDRVAALLADRTKHVVRNVYGRKLFSEPIPMKDRVEEWKLMTEMMDSGGVEAAVSMFRAQGMGPESALREIKRLERASASPADTSDSTVSPSSPLYE
jgi:hypothetical protein